MQMINRRVVCAAVLYPDGTMLVGPRHFDSAMLAQYRARKIQFEESDAQCGFLDQDCNFMSRQEAYLVAVNAGQVKKRPGDQEEKLFSEDLY
jgi:hypothetical protein